VVATYLEATPQQSHFSTPIVKSEMHGARVNVIHTGGGIVGMANPILAEALISTRVPKFSGNAAEEFGEFEKQWKMNLRLMHGASGVISPTMRCFLH
jgi:hypothetical protein